MRRLLFVLGALFALHACQRSDVPPPDRKPIPTPGQPAKPQMQNGDGVRQSE